jgi:excisionase family DNA binding protein
MAALTLRQAAAAVGISRSTLLRQVKAGQISATREATSGRGTFRIDASELSRVYPPDLIKQQSAKQDGAASDRVDGIDLVEIRLSNVRLEEQNTSLREMLEAEKRRSDEWKTTAAQWQEQAQQAQRLLIAAPIITPAPTAPPPSSWWKWWGDRRVS